MRVLPDYCKSCCWSLRQSGHLTIADVWGEFSGDASLEWSEGGILYFSTPQFLITWAVRRRQTACTLQDTPLRSDVEWVEHTSREDPTSSLALYEVSTISTVPSPGAILSNYLHCPLPFSIVHIHFWECYLDQLLYVYWYFSCLRRHHTSLAVVSCLRLQYLLELTINLQIVSKERVSQIGGSSHVCLTRNSQVSPARDCALLEHY